MTSVVDAQCALTRICARTRIGYLYVPWSLEVGNAITREISARSDLDDGIKGNREAIKNRHWVINAAHNKPPLSSEPVESHRRRSRM